MYRITLIHKRTHAPRNQTEQLLKNLQIESHGEGYVRICHVAVQTNEKLNKDYVYYFKEYYFQKFVLLKILRNSLIKYFLLFICNVAAVKISNSIWFKLYSPDNKVIK